jgi:Ca2+-binding RTX toxin-like protein
LPADQAQVPQNLYSSADRFNPGSATWSIAGGDGVDALDYSLLAAGVSVDLAAGTSFSTSTVAGIENVTGTQFADTLRGDGWPNVLYGLGGADLLDGRNGANMVDGGDGNDTLVAASGNDLIRAGRGNDRVTAGGGHDIVYGGDGNDQIDAGDGNDAVFGQADKDNLVGGIGRDILFGGTGLDILDGGAGDDILASGDLTNDFLQSRVEAIRAEWTSNHSYADRVANLRGNAASSTTYGSRLNGNVFLTTRGSAPSIVLPPVAEDKLTGGPAKPGDPNQDWYFGLAAELADRQPKNEAMNG